MRNGRLPLRLTQTWTTCKRRLELATTCPLMSYKTLLYRFRNCWRSKLVRLGCHRVLIRVLRCSCATRLRLRFARVPPTRDLRLRADEPLAGEVQPRGAPDGVLLSPARVLVLLQGGLRGKHQPRDRKSAHQEALEGQRLPSEGRPGVVGDDGGSYPDGRPAHPAVDGGARLQRIRLLDVLVAARSARFGR